jgi:putative endonuclease
LETISLIHPETDQRPSLGEAGEWAALRHLEERGYRIVLTNFKVPVGRNSKGVAVTGEIDIVAVDGETLCFVEVKTRRSDDFTALTTNVDLRKQRQITRTAKLYRRIFRVWEMPYRYDVVTVLMPADAEPTITLYRDFWNDGKFSRARWQPDTWREA